MIKMGEEHRVHQVDQMKRHPPARPQYARAFFKSRSLGVQHGARTSQSKHGRHEQATQRENPRLLCARENKKTSVIRQRTGISRGHSEFAFQTGLRNNLWLIILLTVAPLSLKWVIRIEKHLSSW